MKNFKLRVLPKLGAAIIIAQTFALPLAQINVSAYSFGHDDRGNNLKIFNSRYNENQNTQKSTWITSIKAPETGTFTFYLNSNRGASLYVDNMTTPLITGTSTTSQTEQTATISLVKDQAYRIKVVSLGGKRTQTSLEWSGPSFARTKLSKTSFASQTNTSDSQKPSVPTNLSVSSVGSNTVTLSWTPSSDNVQVSGYSIYRDNVLAGTSNSASFTDSGLSVQTTHVYTVQAFDENGNLSDMTSQVSATTGSTSSTTSDTTAPTQPLNLRQTGSSTSTVSLVWDASSDNNGISKYEIYRNGSLIGTTGTTTSFTDSSLSSNTSYAYTIKAYDSVGNASILSDSLTAWTANSDSSVISGLYGYVNGSSVNLYWNSVSNAIGYNVYASQTSGSFSSALNGSTLVTTNSYTYTAPSSGVSYYIVKPVFSGNSEGTSSNQISVSFTSPSTYTGVTVSGFNGNVENSGIRLNWTATSNAIGYNIYQASSSGNYTTIPVTDFPITDLTFLFSQPVSGNNYFIIKPVFSGNIEGSSSSEVVINYTGTTTTTTTSGSKVIVLQVNNRNMTVNGVSKYVDSQDPYLTTPVLNSNGRVLVPISSLVSELGGTVNWDSSTQKITITYEDKKIEMWIGKSSMVLYTNNSSSGQTISMDVAPYIDSTYNRTMLPIRFVVQYLGENVKWDASSKSITITKN